MIFKKILLFLLFILLVFGTDFLHGGNWQNLRNIGSKFEMIIEALDKDAEKIGLTENRLKTVVELRLRREGITIVDVSSDLEIPYVYINVNVVGNAYNVKLDINEWVDLERIPVSRGCTATVWEVFITGTHGGKSENIVDSLNILFDDFFNDYYKANPKKKEVNHGSL